MPPPLQQTQSFVLPVTAGATSTLSLAKDTAIEGLVIFNNSHLAVYYNKGSAGISKASSATPYVTPFASQVVSFHTAFVSFRVDTLPDGSVAAPIANEQITVFLTTLPQTFGQVPIATSSVLTAQQAKGLQAPPFDLWVPGLGKTIHLWTMVLAGSTAGAIDIHEVDSSNNDIREVAFLPICQANVPFAFPPFLPTGIKFLAPNNKLRCVAATTTAVTVGSFVTGNEE